VLDEAAFKELDDEDMEPCARTGNDKPPQLIWTASRL
jgi:hypothetical protein